MTPFQTWRGRLQAIALAAAAVSLVAVANVAARQDAPGGPGGPGMRGPFPFAQLNLSADQKSQIQTIFKKHREADRTLMEQLRTANQSLRAAIFSSATPDTAQVESLTTQVADLEAKALRARIATQVEVASILTDDQRQQMATMQPRGPRRGPRE